MALKMLWPNIIKALKMLAPCYAAIHLQKRNPKHILTYDLWPFVVKMGTLASSAMGNIHNNFHFSMLFSFQARSPYKTDKQMGKACNAAC